MLKISNIQNYTTATIKEIVAKQEDLFFDLWFVAGCCKMLQLVVS